jgi:hypothetical protein
MLRYSFIALFYRPQQVHATENNGTANNADAYSNFKTLIFTLQKFGIRSMRLSLYQIAHRSLYVVTSLSRIHYVFIYKHSHIVYQSVYLNLVVE